MVRVLKCHGFASLQVAPVEKEPLAICAVEDKIFVATVDCEIVVYKVSQGTTFDIKKLPTISQVDKILYNSLRNYIVTVELKSSWKRVTHSVRVYLNWQGGSNTETKSRTKVRVAGKSHVQHLSALPDQTLMDIIEVPVDSHATCIAVCQLTGNFAIACGEEVKLCSIVEKTVSNTNRTYMDVEVFLELCWKFPVLSISLCEEFVICSSKTEVQAVKVKYVDRQYSSTRPMKHPPHSPIATQNSRNNSSENSSPAASASQSVISETFEFPDSMIDLNKEKDIYGRKQFSGDGLNGLFGGHKQDWSHVGMRHMGSNIAGTKVPSPTLPINDDHFLEWNFHPTDESNSSQILRLPRLQSKIMQANCPQKSPTICPPVVMDASRGGSVKSNYGVDTETVIYLNDFQGKEEWISVSLVPTHLAVPNQNLYNPPSGTNRMKSFYHSGRTNMCCYVSGSRGGYLYQLAPVFTEISSYQYSNKAYKVGCGKNHLHVATDDGLETYTSRWASVALESIDADDRNEQPLLSVHPPVKLDICLCGHETFKSVVDISVGNGFLALLSKVQGLPGMDECAWSLYVVHGFTLLEQFNEMMQFAEKIKTTGPASYIHLLQEAHLLISTNILLGNGVEEEIHSCLSKVCRLLGDYYAQPNQDSWRLCAAYYRSLNICADELVVHAKTQSKENTYGKGIIDFLEKLLFSDVDDSILPSSETASDILEMFFHSAPEQLSKLILLSRLKGYKSESAFEYLNDILSNKSSTGQIITTVDKLAMTQIQLERCDVEMAHTHLKSMTRSELIHICVHHPELIRNDCNEFTPLAQLLRRRRSADFLDILVEMLDECVISLDSLLILLKNQDETDSLHNAHIKQILELVLTDEKRMFLFESVASHLCEIYITQIKEGKDHSIPLPINQGTQYKFTLPQGGFFAPRFSWLDELPPFQGPDKMLKPCQYLQVKVVPGQSSKTVSKPARQTAEAEGLKCPCCRCNENLLKLQSLLCSQHFSVDLAHTVLDYIKSQDKDAKEQDSTDDKEIDMWDSIVLLCEIKINIQKAMEKIVDAYPTVVATFASTCLNGNLSLYSDLMKFLETTIKKSATTSLSHQGKDYVTSYKDLLKKASELFSPVHFLELLPSTGKPLFFLPYLVHNLELEQIHSLKSKIVDMGSELLSHTN